MQFSDDDLREFIEIWSGEFHEALSMKDARAFASTLMDLFSLLASDHLANSDQQSHDEVLPVLQKIE
jgi:hypothetical protein